MFSWLVVDKEGWVGRAGPPDPPSVISSRPKFATQEPTLLPLVEIYTQPWCSFCARARNLLTEKGVAFREIEAPAGTKEREDARARSGGLTSVPQIFINGTHIGGSDDLRALDRSGKLDAMLAEAG